MTMFTAEMKRWLSENAGGKMYDELTFAFNARFGSGFSIRQIQCKCVRSKITTGTQHSGRRRKKSAPIGTVKVCPNGLAYVKVSGPGKAWKLRHLVEWEAANGPLPQAHVVVHADGDKNNFAIDNLLLVHRRELHSMNIHGMWSSDPVVTKTNLLIVRHRLAILDRVKGLVHPRAEALEAKVRRLGPELPGKQAQGGNDGE